MLNCFFQPKMKENEISRSFDQLAVLFQRKFFEDKVTVNLNRLTDLSKPTNKMKQNDTMKQRIAVYYSLLWMWILVKNRHK